MAEMQPEVGLEQPAEGEREGGEEEEEAQGAGEGRGCLPQLCLQRGQSDSAGRVCLGSRGLGSALRGP